MRSLFIKTAIALATVALLAACKTGDATPTMPADTLLSLAFGGLIVNASNLSMLTQGFKTSFQRGLGQAQPQWSMIATKVPSSTREEKYGWLGKIPNVREWVGDRVVQNIMQHDYAIKNKDWELTLGVDRNDIDDDQYGIYGPLFEEMGRSVTAHPDQQIWPLLKGGFASECYDGQYFFDTDHPVLDADGAPQSVANTDGGAGTAWFLIDDTRALKPIIFQERKPFNFVAKDRPTDDNVFDKKTFVYGSDARSNFGFGFWQFAWGSKQALNKANYSAAYAALMAMKGDYGRPLGVMPKKLVVPPSLRTNGLEILNAERDAAGATNVEKGTAELVVVPWLA